jgi:chorismate mutase
MTRQFKDWRTEIDAVDAEIVWLCERRVKLAIEIFKTLRTELSLGDLSHDADRLLLLLFEDCESSILESSVVKQLFRLLSQECRRVAEQVVQLNQTNNCEVTADDTRIARNPNQIDLVGRLPAES